MGREFYYTCDVETCNKKVSEVEGRETWSNVDVSKWLCLEHTEIYNREKQKIDSFYNHTMSEFWSGEKG